MHIDPLLLSSLSLFLSLLPLPPPSPSSLLPLFPSFSLHPPPPAISQAMTIACSISVKTAIMSIILYVEQDTPLTALRHIW